MNEISFFNETDEEIKELEILKNLIDYATTHEKINNAVFSITLINDEKMHEMNKQYRNIDRTTDVLSFAFEDNEDVSNVPIRMLGDIYISIDKAHEQSISYGHSYLRELSFLMIHGFLHLLGYDHMQVEDEKEMFAKQEEILNEFGITR
jgi:probable rRNA maturation factor